MRKGFTRPTAVCPYYKRETSGAIYCGDRPGMSIHCTFDTRTAKLDWVHKYCCCAGQMTEETRTCRWARVMDESIKKDPE